MYSYIAEFIGTLLLVFLGLSVNASNSLTGSFFKGTGAVYEAFGWGAVVGLVALLFVNSSGAYYNPSVTLAIAISGGLSWTLVPGYIVCQFLGAFIGAILVWVFFFKQFNLTDDPTTILKVFVTKPIKQHTIRDIFCEAIGTMMLMILNTNVPPDMITNSINFIFINAIIMSLTYSFASVTGLALNPARDLMPRLAHSILPIKNKGNSDWKYSYVPVVGPLIGATLGVLIGNWIATFPIIQAV